MSHRGGDETTGAPGELSPRVDLATFKEIVEGRRRCPAISQLARLVEREMQDLEPHPGDQETRKHLDDCLVCAELCAAIRSVAQAADRAVERTITGLSAPSP